MKSIITQAVIEGIRARKDRSLGLTISTPELTVQEKALFMELQGIAVDLKITPCEEVNAPEQMIDKDIEQKTQSQRIRNTLFVLWQRDNQGLEFEQYYRVKTERYIEFLKAKIED
ncbi:MAG TPA: hypothetical protein VH186_06315 [Chloroflexia bacterium]|nr:hypothetical protein [Chloroflexia bacterium]